MKNKSVLLSSLAIVVGAASMNAAPAFAGTEVTNSFTNRHVYNGYSEGTTVVNQEIQSVQHNYSESVKAESYGGNTNIATVNYDGSKFTANAYSTSVIVDPVAIITVAKQNEVVNTSVEVDQVIKESFNFSERTYSHTVSSSAN